MPSLIVNDDMSVNLEWNLWSAEVDLLAKTIKGKKIKITQQDINNFLSGVLEALVMNSISNVDARELAELAQLKKGMTSDDIKSYLRGWDTTGEVLAQKSVD